MQSVLISEQFIGLSQAFSNHFRVKIGSGYSVWTDVTSKCTLSSRPIIYIECNHFKNRYTPCTTNSMLLGHDLWITDLTKSLFAWAMKRLRATGFRTKMLVCHHKKSDSHKIVVVNLKPLMSVTRMMM